MLIGIALCIILAIVVLLIFLFKGINKKSYIADDGTIFDKKSDLDVYNSLYEKTKDIFSIVDDNGSNQPILGFEKLFLLTLTKEGFKDLKTLVKYRAQLKSLSDLINL